MAGEISTKRFNRAKKTGASKIEALNNAQKIAFAPFTFQIVATMLELGILEFLSKKAGTLDEVEEKLKLSNYTVRTIFDAALSIGLIEQTENAKYTTTSLADAFLYDEMTIVNFNFMKDVCYLGASALCESFLQSKPRGLQKFFTGSPTIYPVLAHLNKQVKDSWYAFDHFYSNDCFDEILKIIFKNFNGNTAQVFDIGGNTGNFARRCLEFDKNCTVTMLDLPVNIEIAKQNISSPRCGFHSLDVLENKYPKMSGAVLMSQFLDCFSHTQIVKILNAVAQASDDKTRIYILEPFIDNQHFEGANYALTHISLYFTTMANGVSKMYSEAEMLECIEESDLKMVKTHYDIGKHNYTLLECIKK
ncbi:methyltransferase type 12 [Candidatus Gastranaerophilus sp. (ex Termes propinquus)]|nr:methyltransferase type 12 [Candidatus Gastranaerophilus sp. (ex Termes propinquus)]